MLLSLIKLSTYCTPRNGPRTTPTRLDLSQAEPAQSPLLLASTSETEKLDKCLVRTFATSGGHREERTICLGR